MNPDLLLTLGIVLFALTIPSLLAAWVDGRAPRVGSIMVVVSLSLVLAAVTIRPGGYAFNEVPDAMMRLVSRYTK